MGKIGFAKKISINNSISEKYRSDNARKVNSLKKPNGYLYLIKLVSTDIYKIGVSSNPKRRIQDLRSANPFDIEILFLKHFEDVYSLEEQVLQRFEHNKIKGEWFNAYSDDILQAVKLLLELHTIENG